MRFSSNIVQSGFAKVHVLVIAIFFDGCILIAIADYVAYFQCESFIRFNMTCSSSFLRFNSSGLWSFCCLFRWYSWYDITHIWEKTFAVASSTMKIQVTWKTCFTVLVFCLFLDVISNFLNRQLNFEE